MSILGTATGRAYAGVMPMDRILKSMAVALGDPGKEGSAAKGDRQRGGGSSRRNSRTRFGTCRGKPIPGVNAFSAPVFDHEHEPVLVITALGHQDSFSAD